MGIQSAVALVEEGAWASIVGLILLLAVLGALVACLVLLAGIRDRLPAGPPPGGGYLSAPPPPPPYPPVHLAPPAWVNDKRPAV